MMGVDLKPLSLPPAKKVETTRPIAAPRLGASAPPIVAPKFVEPATEVTQEPVRAMAEETKPTKVRKSMTRLESNNIILAVSTYSLLRDDKKRDYASGWSDARVATLVSAQCSSSPAITAEQVEEERERTFLDWAPKPKKAQALPGGSFGVMVKDLRERVALLEQMLNEQDVRIKALEARVTPGTRVQEQPVYRGPSLHQG